MGVPDIQQAAKATDNFVLLKSSLEQCEKEPCDHKNISDQHKLNPATL